jgi:4-amino-4-deoxy-L-arabinose transferase-like glycosyltransferase
MRLPSSIALREILILIAIGLVSFLPFLGAAPLFDWDEINFAESAREMIVSGNYFQVQINFEPFWEKPPLFIWMQVACMKVFGINEFAARLPNAIIGVFTLCMLYIEGSRLGGKTFGRLVTAFFFCTVLPFAYFKSGIIDPTFNFFIFLGLMQIIRYERGKLSGNEVETGTGSPWWAGFWIGVATLTKGPVALIVAFLIYLVYKLIWDRKNISIRPMLQFTAVFLLVILTWFGGIIVLTEDGLETVRKFIVYQAELFSQDVAGHARPFYYHALVFTFGCFPMAAFAYRGMTLRPGESEMKLLKRFMVAWFWVVMVLFSIATTKIVHYSSLLYFPGAFLAAMYFKEMLEGRRKVTWDIYLLYGFGMLIFGALAGSVNIFESHLAANGFYLDAWSEYGYHFAVEAREVAAAWTNWEFLPGVLFLVVLAVNLYYLIHGRFRRWLIVQVVAMPLYLNAINALIVPRIADITQNSAIHFFEEIPTDSAFIMVDGYKSYAHLFYGRIQAFPYPEIPLEDRGAWMARGPVDRPVYLVTKAYRHETKDFSDVWFPEFEILGRKGGFDFFLRKVPTFDPNRP